MKNIYLPLLILFLVPYVQVDASFLPPQSIPILDQRSSHTSAVTKKEFDQILDQLQLSYEDAVKAHGGQLVIKRDWDSDITNASVFREFDSNNWVVVMNGGLARAPKASVDIFTLIACHEMGHLLAGFPLIEARTGFFASEGEADYFATRSCTRRLWKDQIHKNAQYRTKVHPTLKSKCDSVWKEQQDRDLCYRTAAASESHAEFYLQFRHIRDNYDAGTTDPYLADFTHLSWSGAQCRLDTHVAGALCLKDLDLSTIPGFILPDQDYPGGQQSASAEAEATEQSCTRASFYKEGNRPRCWFKPELKPFFELKSVKIDDFSGNQNGIIDPSESADIIVEIKSLADKTYEQIKCLITSAQKKIKILQGQSDYSPFPAEATRIGDSPFKVQATDDSCGEDIELDIKLDLGPGQEAHFVHTTQVGPSKFTAIKIDHSQQIIPDYDVRRGIGILNTTLPIDETGEFNRVHVSVDITHSNRGDLILKLFSPTGEEFVLYNREERHVRDLKRQFSARLPKELQTKGNWKLQIADDSPSYTGDTEMLNEWSIRFSQAICQ